MTEKELEALLHEKIPISQSMGIRVASFVDDVLTIEADFDANINLHGTAFAGSLYAINALCGWSMVHLQLHARGIEGSIVLANGNIRYAKPVAEHIVARCDFSDHTANMDELRETGKTRFTITSRIDAAGELAAEFQGDYAVLVRG